MLYFAYHFYSQWTKEHILRPRYILVRRTETNILALHGCVCDIKIRQEDKDFNALSW